MLMGQKKTEEVMEDVPASALKTFSVFTKLKVITSGSQFTNHEKTSHLYEQSYDKKMYNLLISAEIFGALKGKNYLFMNDEDSRKVFDSLQNASVKKDLENDFLREFGNILFASAVTLLSNRLNLQVFGDTPVLVSPPKLPPLEVVAHDFKGHTPFINAFEFTFEDLPLASMLFLCVLDV